MDINNLYTRKLYGGVLGGLTAAYLIYRRWSNVLNYGCTERKAVVITGCDSGLGYSLALHCATSKPGLVVIATLLEPENPGLMFLKSVAEETRRIHLVRLDLTDERSVESAVGQIGQLIADQDLELLAVVNNAGVMVFGEFEWQTNMIMERQLGVNLLGTMRFTKHILPLVRRHKSRLINVTSHCGLSALPGLSVYSATKAALNSWSDSLRTELDKFGVKVIKFVPGSFVSESRLLARQSFYAEEMAKEMKTEAKLIYGEYFERYSAYLSKLPVALAPVKLKDDGIYNNIEHALFSSDPQTIYINAPMRYKVYHFLFSILPVRMRDVLVKQFVSMPSWVTDKK